ncbi:MAG: hypothetical protein E7300_03690 [Lachnospiraceae bacterium]|nr:hypothetical protein [Lachnospiraceae bacterium]
MTRDEVWDRAKKLAGRPVVVSGTIPFDWFQRGSVWKYMEADLTDTREAPYVEGDLSALSLEEELKLREFAVHSEQVYIEREKRLMEEHLMIDWLLEHSDFADSLKRDGVTADYLIADIRRMCKETGIKSLFDENTDRIISKEPERELLYAKNEKRVPQKEKKDPDRPVVKLTGRPISDELRGALERLDQYNDVDIDVLMSTPEMVLAKTIVSKGEATIKLVGREELWSYILDHLLDRGNYAKDKRLDVVIGLPGSGKTETLANTLAKEFNSRIVGADQIKQFLPDFNNGWGDAIIQKETQVISEEEFVISISRDENVVLVQTGHHGSTLLSKYIAYALNKGYSVNAHYVTLAKSKAKKRALEKFVYDGEYISPELIEYCVPSPDYNHVTRTFDFITMLSDINLPNTTWSNDVKEGEAPVLLSNVGASGKYIDDARRPTGEWLSQFPERRI